MGDTPLSQGFEREIIDRLARIETLVKVQAEDSARRVALLEASINGDVNPGLRADVAMLKERTSPGKAAVGGGSIGAVIALVVGALLKQFGVSI